jgi:hypothetical protein
MIGAKHGTESADAIFIYIDCVVGERSLCDEGKGVTHAGA